MTKAMIEAADLGRCYHTAGITVPALSEVNLTIDEGEFVALVGPSGSGKSTLLSLLGLLDQPTQGSYRLCGEETRGLDANARAHLRSVAIGFVFQSYNLLARHTALENVALPLAYSGCPRRKRHAQAAELLSFVGLEHRMDHRPNQLSGGEQQRVAIARALVNNPALILADEPTGALDTRTGDEIMQLLKGLKGAGHTIVLVTHEARIASQSDRTIRMQDGRVLGPQDLATLTIPLRPAAGRTARAM